MSEAIPLPPPPVPHPDGPPAPPSEPGIEQTELVTLLTNYLSEAIEARRSGPSARDVIWQANVEAYWRRADMTKKADWQSKHVLPEVPNFVERFAAGLRQALERLPRFFTITDPADPTNRLGPMAERLVQAALDRSGKGPTGQRIGFGPQFADGLRAGCLKLTAFAVNVESEPVDPQDPEGRQNTYITVSPVDGSEIFFDPTGRGLYRIRRSEVDRHELDALKEQRDTAGKPLYNADAIERLQASITEELHEERRRMAGTDTVARVGRKPILLDEFLCTILDRDGNRVAANQLVILANEREIIRGPEPNPYWHGRDWIVASPIFSVPFSPYGASYLERFGPLAEIFNEFTNLILDAVTEHSIPAKMIWPEALEDPEQAATGNAPGKTYLAAEGWPPGQPFVQAVETGKLPPETALIWQQLERKMREGAFQGEIDLGGLGKTHISAQAVAESQSSQSTLAESIAGDIEGSILSPLVELVWWTQLQHLDESDPEIRQMLGEENFQMLMARREDFRRRRFRMKAHGISGLIARGRKLQALLGFLNVVGGNPILAQEFLRDFSLAKLISELLMLFGIDPETLRKPIQERIQDAAATAAGTGPGGSAPQPAAASTPATSAALSPLGGARLG